MDFPIRALMATYQSIAPVLPKRRCLFRESCSKHVARIGKERGTLAALGALWRRICQCRPGIQYRVDPYTGAPLLFLADGSNVSPDQLKSDVVQLAQVRWQVRPNG